ncbi:MAG: EAL domain-containing protein [Atopobiaceae bacterium]|nr:EAL domain-containing protein [Atopobiaceae bacterium]
MLEFVTRVSGLQHHSTRLRAFMARSNMEVMSYVAPTILIAVCLTFASTFVPVPLWVGRPSGILDCYRVAFALIGLVSMGCWLLSYKYLNEEPKPVYCEMLTLAFVGFVVFASLWITFIDFAELGRYFFLLVALFVLFGLFYVPALHTLFFEALVGGAMLALLKSAGLFSHIQVVTLTAYLVVVFVVAVSNYDARLRVGMANERIIEESRQDVLTGTFNRRAFDEDARAFKDVDLCVILADIDEFKRYNDLFGHAFGDAVLVHFGSTLVDEFGAERVYHFASDEFIVTLVDVDQSSLQDRIERWRRAFKSSEVDGRVVEAGCSAGCAFGHVADENDVHDLLRIADMLLFRSKENGRNQVTFAEYSEGLLTEALTLSSASGVPEESLDPLTGLMDSEYFVSHATDVASMLLARGYPISLVYLNLTNFANYNARYGFAEGDELLRFVATTLREVFSGRLISRFGDDHFVLMTEEEGLPDAIRRACRAVREERGGTFNALHAGIYRYMTTETSIRKACDMARLACESLHGNYDALYCYYTEELGRAMERRDVVLERFSSALKKGHIQPYYQPIVRSASDCICEFEILSRWIDPDEGMISPAGFIPVLEDVHLIHLLDLHIVEEVCKNFVRFMELGLPVCPVSINFSRLDFEACDVVAKVVESLDRYGLPHHLIRVEITESALSDQSTSIRDAIERFHEQGMLTWMDDFGSGYSSLNVLRDYQFDLVKFDMSFVKQLDAGVAENPNAIMLTNLVSMCKELGLQTLIEGVETTGQLSFLRGIAFEKIQGYVFAPAQSFEVVCSHLREGSYLVEPADRRAYYDKVGSVNIVNPIARDATFDPLGMSGGMPAAVMEYAGGEVRYLEYNAAYVQRMEHFGKGDCLCAANLLNDTDGKATADLNEALIAMQRTDDWVVVGTGVGIYSNGYARCVARVEHSDAFAFLFYAAPLPVEGTYRIN